jgi:hypothetical protein
LFCPKFTAIFYHITTLLLGLDTPTNSRNFIKDRKRTNNKNIRIGRFMGDEQQLSVVHALGLAAYFSGAKKNKTRSGARDTKRQQSAWIEKEKVRERTLNIYKKH